ncbi:GNAT family N-acetyltransferase [Vibrio salinus]|uniref:GNAT family N-acetyltransferase n=1 Tax=Vibrio salinus TaxID=2899784 RepID=UPI001E62DF96|nr:GNAT family N-acetyltransferase [Vibrio salinus]MCE0494883.1 GNAT family N-acetyltransferase [Vibrio salinus]
MDLQVREATVKDISVISELGRTTYKDHFSDIWHDIDTFLDNDFTEDAIQTCINSPSESRYYLAMHENRLVGFAKLNLNTELHDRGCPCIELQKIYLKKECVGMNIGSILMEKVAKLASETRSKYIWLDVLKTNTQAQNFYQKHGFHVIDEIPYKTDKYEIGMLVMAKSLHGNK